MAFVHRQSCEGVKSELDLFSVPTTQTSIESGQWIDHQPLTALDAGGPIEFLIPGSGDDYLDLSSVRLYVRAKVVKGDGTALANDSVVAPVNNFLHSMFSQVDVTLNGTLVTPSSNTYPFRAYLETLLSYGPDAKKSQLEADLWCKDTAGRMEATNNNNGGFAHRHDFVHESREFDMIGRLHVDVLMQNRCLVNGVDLKMRLVRSKDAFALMGDVVDPGFKIVLLEAYLQARKVKLNPAVQLGHIKALTHGTAKYPMRRVDCKVFSIPQGTMSHTHENVYLGTLPRRVFMCLIDNDAYNGAYDKNPFNAKHNDINFFALYVDGRQVPSKPLQPDFAHRRYIRSYMNLFAATGKAYEDEGFDVTRGEFGSGYTIFGFDLSPDCCDGEHFNVVRTGNLRAEIHFVHALARTVNVVVYGEFETVLEIDKNRNVVYDF